MELQEKKEKSQSIIFEEKVGNFFKIHKDFRWGNSESDLDETPYLSIVDKIFSLHSGLHSFEPTIDDTLLQIPDKFFKKNELLYYTVEPYSLHVNLIKCNNTNKHRGIIYLFKQTNSQDDHLNTCNNFKFLNKNQRSELIIANNQQSDHIKHYNKMKTYIYNKEVNELSKIKSPIEQSKILMKKTEEYMKKNKLYCNNSCIFCLTINRFN